MKKILIALILLATLGDTAFAQTYYYKLTKKVVGGNTSTNVSGGQFITFTSNNKCYESDKNGYTVGNGVAVYNRTENGISVYVGETYYGQGIVQFNGDKSVMNIKAGGSTYVYRRTTAPAGVTTCSLIRSKQPSTRPAGGGYYPPSTPSTPQYPQGGNVGGSTGNNSRPSSTTTRPALSQDRECPTCHGSGKCESRVYGTSHCRGTGTCQNCLGKGYVTNLGIGSGTSKCTYCNGTGRCHHCKGTGRCSTCGGTGRVR